MSDDPGRDYFADRITEDIITELSRIHWLFVIARNSTFTYKGRAVDVTQVGRELGVRYALEGGVRQAGGRVRITAQLIDAATGAHLWADRFDGPIEDIFAFQDRVTASVVGAIAPKLEQTECERAKRKPTENLNAYDYFLRGMASLYRYTQDTSGEALRFFQRAIDLDPDFAAAYGMAGRCYAVRQANRWMIDAAQEIAEAARLARQAFELGADDAVALCNGGWVLDYLVQDHAAAAVVIDRAAATYRLSEARAAHEMVAGSRPLMCAVRSFLSSTANSNMIEHIRRCSLLTQGRQPLRLISRRVSEDNRRWRGREETARSTEAAKPVPRHITNCMVRTVMGRSATALTDMIVATAKPYGAPTVL